ERGDALVSELKDMFGVSEVTVRADLAALADRGLIVRTHGGAVLPEPGSKAPEPTFAAREMANVELKRRIGEAAAALIQNGQSVVLDASTTALQIARVMRRRESVHDVNVITNGVHTALELLDTPGVSTILTGGQLRATAVSLTGALGADLLSRVHATLGLFGARGLTTSQAPALAIDSLTVERRSAPIGIDARRPRFAWHVAGDGPHARQAAYHLQLIDAHDARASWSAPTWDSGMRESRDSTYVVYDGPPLSSRGRHAWRVRVRDGAGATSDWSAPAEVEMGLRT